MKCCSIKKVIATITLLLFAITAPAWATPYFSTDFENGLGSEFFGAGIVEGTQGYASYGFGESFLRNTTGSDETQATILELTGLPTHTSIDLEFLVAIIDSWDNSAPYGPDHFNVQIDDNVIFSSLMIGSGVPNSGAPLMPRQHLGFRSKYDWHKDIAYDMGVGSLFRGIEHNADTLTVQWYASGSGWQGGADESWAIDNISVTLNGVPIPNPEPTTMLLLGAGLLGMAAVTRRKTVR